MNIEYGKLVKMVLLLAVMCVVIGALSRVLRMNSESLNDYASANPDIAYMSLASSDNAGASDPAGMTKEDLISNLSLAKLNASQPLQNYTLYSQGFYYAPLSDALEDYIIGRSYPKDSAVSGAIVSVKDLCFLHIWYFNFSNEPVEGALICNKAIVQDLAEIFCELYRNKYCLESVLPVDEWAGSRSDAAKKNDTFCFGYYGSDTLSALHSKGLCVCVNPVYNPSVTFDSDNQPQIFPEGSDRYTDRHTDFPYRIDTQDLCFRLFTEHGFTWGGNLNSQKNYASFEKPLKEKP